MPQNKRIIVTDLAPSTEIESKVKKFAASNFYSPGTLLGIFLVRPVTKTQAVVLNFNQFIKKTKSHAPPLLARSVTGYVYGLFYQSKNTAPFLLLHISDHHRGFAGTLEWEQSMASDLSHILLLPRTTSDKKFVDKIIKNENARVLYGNDDNVLLLWSFITQDKLLITTDKNTFVRILEEVRSS